MSAAVTFPTVPDVPPESLAAAPARAGNPVDLLRNAATPARAMVSPATVDVARGTPGAVVLWGEEHRLRPIGATVAPVPYVQFARDDHRGT
jgi:hypothetical protein